MTARRKIAFSPGCSRPQAGFSLIEVLVAMAVLTVGLISLLSVFSLAVAATHSSQQDMIAKQLASEAMESIFTARNTDQLEWLQIQNKGAGTSPDGIFVQGFQPINLPGNDGIVGTDDDAIAGPEKLHQPGPDGIYGTADDLPDLPLTNYQRQITITRLPDTDSLRTITITVRYTTPRFKVPKAYILTGYISQYR